MFWAKSWTDGWLKVSTTQEGWEHDSVSKLMRGVKLRRLWMIRLRPPVYTLTSSRRDISMHGYISGQRTHFYR